jgi:hypothetical protein
MRDLKAIDLLVTAMGGLTATARKLSTPSKPLTAQHIHNWRTRGRVSPEQRLRFLTVFNKVMKKQQQLDLSWLASPAANYGDGSASNGRKSRRKTQPCSARSRSISGRSDRTTRRKSRAGRGGFSPLTTGASAANSRLMATDWPRMVTIRLPLSPARAAFSFWSHSGQRVQL